MTQRVSTGKKYKREEGPLNDFTCWNHFFQATLSLLWGYSLYITYPEVLLPPLYESLSNSFQVKCENFLCGRMNVFICNLLSADYSIWWYNITEEEAKLQKKSSFRIFQLSIVSFCIWRECKEIISNFWKKD